MNKTHITNYPLVSNCGHYHRTIYLDLKDKTLIHIGCFVGTKAEAITAITAKYKASPIERARYIDKVTACFQIWEDMQG